MGDKIVNTYKSRPDYWIETEDKHRLKPGDSMDVEVIADPMSHLDNTSCEWSLNGGQVDFPHVEFMGGLEIQGSVVSSIFNGLPELAKAVLITEKLDDHNRP